jgi:hypothetical protein
LGWGCSFSARRLPARLQSGAISPLAACWREKVMENHTACSLVHSQPYGHKNLAVSSHSLERAACLPVWHWSVEGQRMAIALVSMASPAQSGPVRSDSSLVWRSQAPEQQAGESGLNFLCVRYRCKPGDAGGSGPPGTRRDGRSGPRTECRSRPLRTRPHKRRTGSLGRTGRRTLWSS